MSKTKISWTEYSWNPIVGCSKVSDGCKNCYAEKMACRLAHMEHPEYQEVTMSKMNPMPISYYNQFEKWNGKTAFVESAIDKPLHWRKPRMIFVSSMGDLFHPSVPFEWIDKVIAVAVVCHHHIFQLLTKHGDRMAEYFKQAGLWTEIIPNATHKYLHHRGIQEPIPGYFAFNCLEAEYKVPIPNLWLGVTIEKSNYLNRAKTLSDIPASIRFISNEPLLEDIRYTSDELRVIDWVIIGAESGPHRRQCKLEWVRNIRDQCIAAGVPVFIKQISINGKVEHDINRFPEDLRIREYPEKLRNSDRDS